MKGAGVKTDFLVIGSGISGLSFALQATQYGKVFGDNEEGDH
jgi:glycine/D-amino acid oxidase-like deaminating enzyme